MATALLLLAAALFFQGFFSLRGIRYWNNALFSSRARLDALHLHSLSALYSTVVVKPGVDLTDWLQGAPGMQALLQIAMVQIAWIALGMVAALWLPSRLSMRAIAAAAIALFGALGMLSQVRPP